MKLLQIRYRKILDSHSKAIWDKMVWEDSFMEFRMQFQLYDQEGKYFSFSHLLKANPKAEQLHFLVGGSIIGYLEQLNGIMPDIIDNIGLYFMPIEDCRFEIINSDRRNIEQHQVAINFYSPMMQWHETIANDMLLVSTSSSVSEDESYPTHLFSLKPYVTIEKLQYVANDKAAK